MAHAHPHPHSSGHDSHDGHDSSSVPVPGGPGGQDHRRHQGGHSHSDAHAHSGDTVDGQAEILDLDAEVLAEHLASVTAWLPTGTPPRRIVDLGCGTGAGTFALLDRFPEADVTAVDFSAAHLQRLREKACARGVDGRIRTVQADLDDTVWPDLGAPDLVWASASMHHMADPDRALRAVRDALAPGGLFVVLELAGFPRFLPENAPEERPGAASRTASCGELGKPGASS